MKENSSFLNVFLCRSSDGCTLVTSSTDGYCTIVTFTEGEIGTPYIDEESQASQCAGDQVWADNTMFLTFYLKNQEQQQPSKKIAVSGYRAVGLLGNRYDSNF